MVNVLWGGGVWVAKAPSFLLLPPGGGYPSNSHAHYLRVCRENKEDGLLLPYSGLEIWWWRVEGLF